MTRVSEVIGHVYLRWSFQTSIVELKFQQAALLNISEVVYGLQRVLLKL